MLFLWAVATKPIQKSGMNPPWLTLPGTRPASFLRLRPLEIPEGGEGKLSLAKEFHCQAGGTPSLVVSKEPERTTTNLGGGGGPPLKLVTHPHGLVPYRGHIHASSLGQFLVQI